MCFVLGCSAPLQMWQLLQGSISVDSVLPFQPSALVGGLCPFICNPLVVRAFRNFIFYSKHSPCFLLPPFFFIKSRFILHESLSVDGPLFSNALNITCVVGRSTFNLTREHLLQLRDFHMFLYGAENYPRQTRLNLYCFVQVCWTVAFV